MSLQARQGLVSRLFFQDPTVQKADLLREAPARDAKFHGTQTQLIALLLGLLQKGHQIEITMVQTGHHDDGPHGHAGGYAVDCWPLASAKAGDYIDASTEAFRTFLSDAAASPWLYQIGLVGDGADSKENFAAAGPTAFQDDGGAHVHLGAHW
ncbi:MAG: hypothetical protein WB609_03680 [Candidatus Cybelea sp.]